MSYTTDVILVCDPMDDAEEVRLLNDINTFFSGGRYLSRIPCDVPGSGYNMADLIAVGCFNYFDDEGFVEHLRSLDLASYGLCSSVQLFVKPESYDAYSVIDVWQSKCFGGAYQPTYAVNPLHPQSAQPT